MCYGARKSLADSMRDASLGVFQGSSEQRERKVPWHCLPSMLYPRVYLVLENRVGPLQEPSEVSSRETPIPIMDSPPEEMLLFPQGP